MTGRHPLDDLPPNGMSGWMAFWICMALAGWIVAIIGWWVRPC